jgi:guanylate kinase
MARPNPPALTAEQRAAAAQAGIEARRARSDVKSRIARTEISIFDAINDQRAAIQRMKVSDLLGSVPGIGSRRVFLLMEKIGIAPTRRIGGLGEHQLMALRKEFLVTKSEVSQGALIVMSGPGGVGKSTITAALRDHPSFWVSISATTRNPRETERDGVDYYFLSEEKFEEMIANGEFLEWAEFAGSRYGTPKEPVENWRNLGKSVLLEIEIAGARQVRACEPNSTLVFISPPSWADLEARLLGRGTDSPERMAARLALAREEMAAAPEFDHILVNERVEEVVATLVSLALGHKAGSNESEH